MIDAETLGTVDEAAKLVGRVANIQAREVHDTLADRAQVDKEALENYINHTVKNLSRYIPMNNDTKTIVAVAMRHVFVTAAMAARLDEEKNNGR